MKKTCYSELEDNNKISSSILEGMLSEREQMTNANSEGTDDDHVVLQVTTYPLAHPPERFQGACINSGAHHTIPGEPEEKSYCKEYCKPSTKSLSDYKYWFGEKPNQYL